MTMSQRKRMQKRQARQERRQRTVDLYRRVAFVRGTAGWFALTEAERGPWQADVIERLVDQLG